jgi:trehalose 6-phosphate phosphatase
LVVDERTEEFDIPGESYVGDDITDEHAFEALAGKGIGVFVGCVDDPEVGGRTAAADFVLHSTEEVERFLNTLAR